MWENLAIVQKEKEKQTKISKTPATLGAWRQEDYQAFLAANIAEKYELQVQEILTQRNKAETEET